MIRLPCFSPLDLDESDAINFRLFGESYIDEWEPLRKPVVGQMGVIYGLTIIETERSCEEKNR